MTGEAQAELSSWQHSGAAASALRLEPSDFHAIPGWAADDNAAALECCLQSARLTGQPVPDPSHASLSLQNPQKARAFFEENFTPFRILAASGLLTAYFEPALKSSRKQSAAFPVPIYRRPQDLSPLPPGHPLPDLGFTAALTTVGGFEPYPARGEIEAGALAGRRLEVLYLADPIEAFVMHVQGSGPVELESGLAVRLTFDGKNGHPYTSISKLLIERGALSREDAHLEGSAQSEAQSVLNDDESYIFFKELDASAGAPEGCSGVELRRGRSLAAGLLYHATGTPIWVSAPELTFAGFGLRRTAARLSRARSAAASLQERERKPAL